MFGFCCKVITVLKMRNLDNLTNRLTKSKARTWKDSPTLSVGPSAGFHLKPFKESRLEFRLFNKLCSKTIFFTRTLEFRFHKYSADSPSVGEREIW